MRRAFTLIELMVVCGVLVVMAALVTPNLVQMKKSRDHEEAYRALLRLAQAGRETAIESGRTYTLTLNGTFVELNRDDDTQLSRDGQSGSSTPYVTTSSSTTAPTLRRLPRLFTLDGKGQAVASTSQSSSPSDIDPDGASVSLPDGATTNNVILDGKTSTASDFTLHFYSDGRSESGGFEIQDGNAVRNLQIDRNGFAKLTDGNLPPTTENNWEAGTYAQRTSTATTSG